MLKKRFFNSNSGVGEKLVQFRNFQRQIADNNF